MTMWRCQRQSYKQPGLHKRKQSARKLQNLTIPREVGATDRKTEPGHFPGPFSPGADTWGLAALPPPFAEGGTPQREVLQPLPFSPR